MRQRTLAIGAGQGLRGAVWVRRTGSGLNGSIRQRADRLGVVSRCTCHWVRAPRQLVVSVVTSVPIRPTCHSKLGFGAWTSSTSPARVYDYCPHVRLLTGRTLPLNTHYSRGLDRSSLTAMSSMGSPEPETLRGKGASRNISLGIGQIAADNAAEQPTSLTRSSRD